MKGNGGTYIDSSHLFNIIFHNKHILIQGNQSRLYYGSTNGEIYLTIWDKKSGCKIEHLFDLCKDPKFDGIFLYPQKASGRALAVNKNEMNAGTYSDCSNKEYYLAFLYKYVDNTMNPVGTMSIRTDEGYGTFYADASYVMPEGVTGYTVTEASAETQDLSLNPSYKGGDIVPGATALLIKGEKGIYPCYEPQPHTVKASRAIEMTANLLRGSQTEALTTSPDGSDNYYFYKLYYVTEVGAGAENRKLGFFWGAEQGKPFTNGAQKAYLTLPKANSANIRGFVLPGNDVTAIQKVSADTPAQSKGIFDISGRKVLQHAKDQLPAGFYIIDGKKILIKK